MDLNILLELRRRLVKNPELWQYDLLSSNGLQRYAVDHATPIYSGDTIVKLWNVGLLRSDMIKSEKPINIAGIDLVSEESGIYCYYDRRHLEPRADGYGGILKDVELNHMEVLFHPFRLYVLYHIHRVFNLRISTTQYLSYPEGSSKIIDIETKHLDQWTSSQSFTERFTDWNVYAELAIAMEPAAYIEVFHGIRWKFPDNLEDIKAKISTYRDGLKEIICNSPASTFHKIRSEICRDAEILDSNKMVHVLLRFMSSHYRHTLKNAIGASMLFLCMAEIIRRAVEYCCDVKIPEEDEMGFGQWITGARKSIYGTERVFDADKVTRREFMRHMGLDFGIKVRCYVEGETEKGALSSAVGDIGTVEFINLRGQVLQRKSKGLAFSESLETDMRSHVFSIIILDGDQVDNLRVLREAAKRKMFFGRFFVSVPDFEFSNFSIEELVTVYIALSKQILELQLDYNGILNLVKAVTSAREFFDVLGEHGFNNMKKSESWGAALMDYALTYPSFPSHVRSGQERPVIEIAQILQRSRDASYLLSMENYQVDPDTGHLFEKPKSNN